MGFGWVDFDAALEVGAVLNADAGREDIADDGAFLLDVHTAADVKTLPTTFPETTSSLA